MKRGDNTFISTDDQRKDAQQQHAAPHAVVPHFFSFLFYIFIYNKGERVLVGRGQGEEEVRGEERAFYTSFSYHYKRRGIGRSRGRGEEKGREDGYLGIIFRFEKIN